MLSQDLRSQSCWKLWHMEMSNAWCKFKFSWVARLQGSLLSGGQSRSLNGQDKGPFLRPETRVRAIRDRSCRAAGALKMSLTDLALNSYQWQIPTLFRTHRDNTTLGLSKKIIDTSQRELIPITVWWWQSHFRQWFPRQMVSCSSFLLLHPPQGQLRSKCCWHELDTGQGICSMPFNNQVHLTYIAKDDSVSTIRNSTVEKLL